MASVVHPDEIDWDEYMQESDPKALVRPASAYMDDVAEYLRDGPGKGGDPLPWQKTDTDIRCRPGEVSVWAGVNGHGKSLLLGFIMLGFMRQKRRCLIASFEMQPRATLARMTRQASQGNAPSDDFMRQFGKWTDGRLWLYDQQVTIRAEQMLAVCRYAHQELGMNHIVIDSLMKCVRGEDDYNGQKEFLDALTTLARATDMHIHLVHHMRKGENESKVGGKFDLKGSGSITDQVDNVFVVWRNKQKQRDMQAKKDVSDDEPDVVLACEKQRHNGEGEGLFKFWYHGPSMQYLESPNHRPQAFLRHLEAVA